MRPLAAFLAIIVSQSAASFASADVIAPIRDDIGRVLSLAHIANGDPPPTIQPFRAVVFSLHRLMVMPDPGLGDPTLLQQDLQRFVEAVATARLAELQAGDIEIISPAMVETSGFQPCEVLYARISFSFQRYDGEWASPDTSLAAVFIEYVQRTVASAAGGKNTCAGPVTPHTFPFFVDLAGPVLFVLRADHKLENVSELRRRLQQVVDYSFCARIVQTRDDARNLVRRWAGGE